MRILAVIGSPRKGGNSDMLVDAMIRGAEEQGAEVEKVYLNDLYLRGCQACDACRGDVDDPCVSDDDMPAVHEKLRVCEALIIGTPIYYFGPSAQTKLFLDRWYALAGREGQPHAMRGKRIAIAFSYADPDPFTSGAHRILRDSANWVGAQIVGTVYGTADAKGEIVQNKMVMEQAVELGRGLVGVLPRPLAVPL